MVNKLLDGKFQGSNNKDDANSWVDMVTIDQTVQTGWNTYLSADSTPYRYVRFVHSSTSRCNIAEIEFYGVVQNDLTVTLTKQPTEIILFDGFNSITSTLDIAYQQNFTAIIESVDPPYGEIFG